MANKLYNKCRLDSKDYSEYDYGSQGLKILIPVFLKSSTFLVR